MFDKWNTPVEFVNLLVENWPTANFFAVPGQHDLPNHNYADIRRSAYWNMVKSGRITTLDPGKLQCIGDGLYVRGFPWGVPVEPMTGAKRDGYCYLSVAHRYVWAGDAKYKDAEVGDCAERPEFGERYRGYDAVVWGDNHKPWSLDVLWHPNKSPTTYFNHGTALRRHADERGLVDMGPGVFGPGVLYDDGSIVRVELDGMPPEVWADAPAKSLAAPLGVDADRLLALLRAGGEAAVSFRDAVDHAKRTAAPPLTPDETAVLDGWLHAAGVLR